LIESPCLDVFETGAVFLGGAAKATRSAAGGDQGGQGFSSAADGVLVRIQSLADSVAKRPDGVFVEAHLLFSGEVRRARRTLQVVKVDGLDVAAKADQGLLDFGVNGAAPADRTRFRHDG
jgi:hypothetical protein